MRLNEGAQCRWYRRCVWVCVYSGYVLLLININVKDMCVMMKYAIRPPYKLNKNILSSHIHKATSRLSVSCRCARICLYVARGWQIKMMNHV